MTRGAAFVLGLGLGALTVPLVQLGTRRVLGHPLIYPRLTIQKEN